MATGFAHPDKRPMYVVPSRAGGVSTGTATANFANLEKASGTLAHGDVTPFAIAANRMEGVTTKSGGGFSQADTAPDSFKAQGESVPFVLNDGGGAAERQNVTVSGGIEYDDAETSGLAPVSRLLLEQVEADHKIAVIVENTPRTRDGVNLKKVYRVHIGNVRSRGSIDEAAPDALSFTFRETSLVHAVGP